MMRVCVRCARLGSRGFLPGDTAICRHRAACQRRAQFVGQWVGARVLQRRDPGGALWIIRPATWVDNHSRAGGFVLTCLYREHRTTSWHPTIDAAKIHRTDIVRSLQARTLADYGRAT
jgi:hypothetical protein